MSFKQINLFLSIVLVILFENVWALKQKGASSIDFTRHNYLQLENTSWSVVENDINQKNVLNSIFDIHRAFVDKYLRQDFYGNEFIILEPIYEWKVLEKDLLSLNSLFDTFRQLLGQYVDSNYDERAISDFAETVLTDKHWPVNETLDQIENIMVKQGLYYKALLVGIFLNQGFEKIKT